jgi:hypothetical protein
VKIKLEGVEYEFDAERMMLSELMAVKTKAGMNAKEWHEALQEFDPLAVQALVYLLKRRAGEDVKLSDIDFNLADFEIVPDEEPDPTPAE